MKLGLIFIKCGLILVFLWMGFTNFISWKENFLRGDLVNSPIIEMIDFASDSRLHRSYASKANNYLDPDRFSFGEDGLELKIPFGNSGAGHIDALRVDGSEVFFSGWAYLKSKDDFVKGVVVVLAGDVIGVAPVVGVRGDVAVALNDTYATQVGFSHRIKIESRINKCQLRFYALMQSMKIWEIAHKCD